jgi:hypothetical protein
MDVMKLQKMATYISTHYYSLMIFQIPTHLYKQLIYDEIF